MELEDIVKFQFKRVNPFQGLVIDTDIWRDAHEYHREQQKLHMLAFHSVGIVIGLEVIASKPPEMAVNIRPGMAVDPEGNVIIVAKAQRYNIQTRDKGTVHVIIQFREVPSEPYQPQQNGQPTRILEAYRIQEREKLPNEPCLELARIDLDPATGAITNARNPAKPGKNEINLNFRQSAAPAAPQAETSAAPAPVPRAETPATPEKATPAREAAVPPVETVTIGHAVLGEASSDLHVSGLQNLIREIGRQNGFEVKLEENITLDKKIDHCAMIYLAGNGRFELTAGQQSALGSFLQSGGTVFGEGCADGTTDAASKGAKEFGLAFNQLATQLKCKMEVVQRGHPILTAVHVFAEVPPGAEPAMLLEGGRMVYSAGDYGCAWQGGHQGQPLSRENIRECIEMGTNLAAYARMMKNSGR